MALATNLSLLALLLLFFTATATATAQPPPQGLFNAADTLSNSGYTAMSLTIQLLLNQSQSPLPSSSSTSLTIFSPPDSAFVASGQPSLSVLLLHFSPLSLSLHSLPFSFRIPTLSSASPPLFVTSKPSQISVNGVRVAGSPLYDDGSIVVFAVDEFFSPNFTAPNPTLEEQTPNPECTEFRVSSRYDEASGVLKSRGYSILASFLDLQLVGHLVSDVEFTLFAPLDETLVEFSGNFLEYKRLFFSHLVPCKLSWSQLRNGTLPGNHLEGYDLNITSSSDISEVRINGVRISAPEIYEDDWLVIHGVQDVIANPENRDEEETRTAKTNAEWESAAPFSGQF